MKRLLGIALPLLLLAGLVGCGTQTSNVKVGLSPGTITLSEGASHDFTASVTGASDPGVIWSHTCGTLSGNGSVVSYTAPSSTGKCTVTATSRVDTSASATSDVTVTAPSGGSTSYSLSLTGSNGSVKVNGTSHTLPYSTTVTAGSTVQLQAVPASGYQFTGWTGDLTGSTNPDSFTMNAAKSIGVQFSATQTTMYSLSLTGSNGTVKVNGTSHGLPYSTSIAAGSTVQLQAVPNSGYQFTGWTGDLTGSTNPDSFTMNAAKSIGVQFSATQPSTYSLSLTGSNGTVKVNGTSHALPYSTSITAGSTVQLDAVPNSGYQFTGWTGDLTGSTNPYSFTMNAAKSIGVSFADVQNPSVTITQPPDNSTVSISGVTVKGTASDNNAVQDVQFVLNNNLMMPCNGTTSWTCTVTGLTSGTNTITVYAFDPAGNGGSAVVHVTYQASRLKWKYTTGSFVVSSPSIASDGTVYTGSNDGYVYAFNPNGTLKWRYHTGGAVVSSPAVSSTGDIYVGSLDGYLYRLSPTGSLQWESFIGSGIGGSPTIASDGTIYVGARNDKVYAVNSNSSIKWSYTTGGIVESSAVIASDGTIYVGSADGDLYALTPTGGLKWKYPVGTNVNASPAIAADGTVYVGAYGGNRLVALTPTGTFKWQYGVGGSVNSSPAVASDGTIYFGASDGFLYALNPNGTIKWSFADSGAGFESSPAIGANGDIYVGCDDDYVYAVSPAGNLVWRYQTGYVVTAAPAIAGDGTIYVGSEDDIFYALNSSAGGLAAAPWPKFNHDDRNTGRM